MKKSSSLFF